MQYGVIEGLNAERGRLWRTTFHAAGATATSVSSVRSTATCPERTSFARATSRSSLPRRDDDGRYAIADQIAQRAGHADKPVDRQDEDEADRRDRRDGIQRGGEDDDRRAGHPVSCLGGHKGNGEDQEKIGERERRVGRLRDEHGRERQID